MATGVRGVGEFCWTNMLTPKTAEAREFFGRVLGWTYFEIPGLGHGVRAGGRGVGALFDLAGPNTPTGTRPHVGVMMKVANADAACERVAALGGVARPAFDIMRQGRMAVCTDPVGAEFDVWEPRDFHGTDVDSNLPGAPSWFEASTTDVERSASFYSGLFGWTPVRLPSPGRDDVIFEIGGDPVAGLRRITPEEDDLRPRWATYFTVGDADAAARMAVGLGATLRVPTRDIAGLGRACGITSPQGVEFHGIERRGRDDLEIRARDSLASNRPGKSSPG